MIDRPGGEGLSSDDCAAHVAGVYAQAGPDIAFWRILHDLGRLTDERLAELIEEDGRHRIARGLPVRLERYIEPVPDLLSRCVPADAAIDMTLRSLCNSARFDSTTVQALIDEYPEVEELIREAAALNNAMWSTTEVRDDFPALPRLLPQDFGRPIETGESRYELRRILGEGAFGQVYLAVDRLLSEQDRPALVAIKVLNSRRRTRWSRERLIEEASKARRVDHPNVVRVLDRGVSNDDEDFITYELVTGGDLYQWLRSRGGRTDPREAAALMVKVARGVQAAHAAGLVHCDLNPGNIILTHDNEPKVADFGVAIRAEETRQREMRSRETGKPIGSKLFISPEQYRCEEGSLTVPSDIYALGGILFTLLTGRYPNGDNLDAIARTHHPTQGRSEPPSIRAIAPNVDPDLEAICRRALSPRPDLRHSSAGAFADDLEMHLRSEPIPWTRPSSLRIARLWVRRKPAVAAISLMLALSVLILGGLALNENRRRQHEEVRAVQAEQARQHEEFRAEIERIRAEEREKRNVEARHRIAQIGALLEYVDQTAATAPFLTAVWNIEHLFRNDAIWSEAGGLEEFVAMRLRTAERIIEQNEHAGRGDDLETLLWRTTLAFWLVAEGDIASLDRADAILQSLSEQWSSRLGEGDAWLGYLEAIRSCSHIKRTIQSAPRDSADDAVVALLHDRRLMLEHYEPLVGEHDLGSPLHILILDTMIDLYGFIEDEDMAEHTARRRGAAEAHWFTSD